MSEYHDILSPYLRVIKLSTPADLVDAMGYCGALLDCWPLHDGLKLSRLKKYMSKRARCNAYVEFDVPKKSGGTRHISAPVDELKKLQQVLSLMLQTMCEVSPHAMGFVPRRSVATNAQIHCGQKVIVNMDLKDFFPSVTKKMVRYSLTKELETYDTSREVINIISSLATAQRSDGVEVLPQGAPTSPVISNLVLKPLDSNLVSIAQKVNMRYSRYADDITISASEYNPMQINRIIATLVNELEQYGFTVNDKKTRILHSNERREVTGLTVGEKVNVSRRYVKQLRTLLHLWEHRGLEEAQTIYNRDFGCETDLAKVINGKINYLLMIKGREDSTYRNFKQRYRKLIKELKDDYPVRDDAAAR